MSLRVVFFGNQQSVFSSRHFQALQSSGAHLVGVVDAPVHKQSTSNPLPPEFKNFADVAAVQDIPYFIPDNPASADFISQVAALDPDLFLAVGYPVILNPALLGLPHYLAANFHASLLPAYRGKHPVFWALRAGERWAGLTVHAMNPGIDTGDILFQVKVRTRKTDSVASLYDRIMDRSVSLVGRLIADTGMGRLNPQPQAKGESSYFSAIHEADYLLDWRWPAEKLRRYVCTTPGKCFAVLRGRRIHLINADTFYPAERHAPGTLLWLGRARVSVAAGKGAISSSRVRVGEECRPLAQLFRRLGLEPGDRLN